MSRAVIDQPGLRISVAGLLVSLALGLILKIQISPARVQVHLQKAVSRLEKDFIVDFESAHVNLANWGLPWPRLEINRVRLSPKKNSCQSSQIFIEQIEVPISWTALIISQTIVDTVRAHNVELRIGDLQNCLAVVNSPTGKVAVARATQVKTPNDAATAVSVSSETGIFQRRTNTQLKEIVVDQLKVVIKDQYQQPLSFRNLHLRFQYDKESLGAIDIQSQILAIKDARTDTFHLVADLNANMKAEAKADVKKEYTVDAHVKGRLLDGDMQLTLQYSSVLQKLNYELNTKKVSVKAFLPLVKSADMAAIFERWPLGLTVNLFGSTTTHPAQTNVLIKTLELAGEKTSIRSDDIEIKIINDEPTFSEFKAEILKLPLNQLRGLNQFKDNLNSFENLGELRGQFQYLNDHDWKLTGGIFGTQLIFSNRGTRELQTIDSIQFQGAHKNKNYSVILSDFNINAAAINGQFEANYNQTNNNLTAVLQAQGSFLNPSIWRQLTQIEQSPELKLNWNYKKSLDERQQVSIAATQLQFEGMKVDDLHIDFIQAASPDGVKSLVLTAKASGTEIIVPAVRNSTVLALFGEDSGLRGEAYRAQKLQLNLKGTNWKNMNFDFNFDLKNKEDEKEIAQVQANGRWKEDSSILALATLQNGLHQLKYDIQRNGQDEVILVPLRQ
ncbi:MAG: hypothetical protein H7061_08480 [Bdellovibrionaceae bacterium]|nr:hypothetical protein [Bdellovibrio sp.]